jgi:hypothetical protein
MCAMRKLPVVPICRNPAALPRPPNQPQISHRPGPDKRGVRVVTNVGRGMRWTRWRRETNDASADGKVVWS